MPLDIAVDEAMVPFKGHISFCQVCPKSNIFVTMCVNLLVFICTVYQVKATQKRHKCICVVELNNGYIYDFNVYVGEWVYFYLNLLVLQYLCCRQGDQCQ